MFYKNFTKEQVVSCAIDSYRGVSTNEKFSAEERKETINEVINDLAKEAIEDDQLETHDDISREINELARILKNYTEILIFNIDRIYRGYDEI